MSHFTTLATQFVSAPHLVKALRAMGFPEVEVFRSPQPLIGVDGYVRPERAEIVVRRKHVGEASNDLGFCRQPDGRYLAVISDWDRQHYNEAWLQTLAQRYAYFVAKEAMAEQGFSVVSEEADPDRSMRLHLRRMT
jgi:hypothetical protein